MRRRTQYTRLVATKNEYISVCPTLIRLLCIYAFRVARRRARRIKDMYTNARGHDNHCCADSLARADYIVLLSSYLYIYHTWVPVVEGQVAAKVVKSLCNNLIELPREREEWVRVKWHANNNDIGKLLEEWMVFGWLPGLNVIKTILDEFVDV